MSMDRAQPELADLQAGWYTDKNCPMFCMQVEMVDAEKMVMGPCCCLGVLWCPGACQDDKVKDPSLGPNSYRGDKDSPLPCGMKRTTAENATWTSPTSFKKSIGDNHMVRCC